MARARERAAVGRVGGARTTRVERRARLSDHAGSTAGHGRTTSGDVPGRIFESPSPLARSGLCVSVRAGPCTRLRDEGASITSASQSRAKPRWAPPPRSCQAEPSTSFAFVPTSSMHRSSLSRPRCPRARQLTARFSLARSRTGTLARFPSRGRHRRVRPGDGHHPEHLCRTCRQCPEDSEMQTFRGDVPSVHTSSSCLTPSVSSVQHRRRPQRRWSVHSSDDDAMCKAGCVPCSLPAPHLRSFSSPDPGINVCVACTPFLIRPSLPRNRSARPRGP